MRMLSAWLITIMAFVVAEVVGFYLTVGLIFDNPFGYDWTSPGTISGLELLIIVPITSVACLIGSRWSWGLLIAGIGTIVLLALGLLVTWQFWMEGWFTDGGYNLLVFPGPIVPGIGLFLSTLAMHKARGRRVSLPRA